MELSRCAFLKMLLSARNVCAGWKVCHELLAHPTAVQDSGLRVGERPLQIGYLSCIGGLSSQVVRVLQIDLSVGSTCPKLVIELLAALILLCTENWTAFSIGTDWLALLKLSMTRWTFLEIGQSSR